MKNTDRRSSKIILRGKFVPERGETGILRLFHIEVLYKLNVSPDSIRMIKLRQMICTEHVACIGK